MILNAFILVLNMSISAGIAGLLLIGWRYATRNYIPSRYCYLLWSTMFFRLTVPFSFSSVLSAFNLLRGAPGTPVGSHFLVTMEYVDGGTIDRLVKTPGKNIVLVAVSFLWLAAAAGLIVWWLAQYLRIRSALQYAVLVRDPLIGQVSQTLRMRRCPAVYWSDKVSSPVLTGLLHPRILLPKHMELTSPGAACILAHEMVHQKRCDQITKAVLFLICAFHWYNPVAWICLYLFHEDIELSCDQEVLRIYGYSCKKQYALALVNCADVRSRFAAGYLAFARSRVADRVNGVLQYRKLSRGKAAMFTILTLLIGLSVSANPVLGDQYTYIPDIVWVDPGTRAQIRRFADGFAQDLAAGDAESILAKSTADPNYFAPLYEVFAREPLAVRRQQIFYTSPSSAVVYLSLEKPVSLFGDQVEDLALTIEKQSILNGFYAESLHSYADYEAMHTVDESSEAVMLCRTMIKYGLVSGENTRENGVRIASFCMDIAYNRQKDKTNTVLPAQAVYEVAQEFFALQEYRWLKTSPAYDALTDTYAFDPDSGSRFEYQILSLETGPEGAVVTVEFYKDPLQTQREKTVQYTFRRVE